MPLNLAQKLIEAHLEEGDLKPGKEIALSIDQTLTQDATGTMVMLELEAMGLNRVKTELSAQYVDHNLVQQDFRNPDDHRFLFSACQRYGIWFSGPGNGVSHPVHMQRFGIPGKSLLGSDSHTCAAGSLGMLAMGAGGLDVALAMAGEPFHTTMPEIIGVELTGSLPDWVSAKDVILEMLRRLGVDGGRNRILEYHGPGLETLSAMDRHVIANMGQETGATASVFPSDEAVRAFMRRYGREDDWTPLAADKACEYDHQESVDLSSLEPLIAKPSSPGNVVAVSEVEGEPIGQAYIGSSANPGFRDFAVPALMVEGKTIARGVSFDINPSSRAVLQALITQGYLSRLISAGARLHQAGCNGCIGMGQAPASDSNSLRTVPRNFPGRSGTREDRVWLCSPETATASALSGRITDPRRLDMDYPTLTMPESMPNIGEHLYAPLAEQESEKVALEKGPNIRSLPDFDELPDELEVPVLLKVGDNLTTDEILRGGTEVLPYRSNIPAIAQFCFEQLDEQYAERAQEAGSHCIVGGQDYGQGSSREHAQIAPRYLGLRFVIAKSFARIAWQNMVSYGILPLQFEDEDDYERVEQGATVKLSGLHEALRKGKRIDADIDGERFSLSHGLSSRQARIVLRGSMINLIRDHANR